MGTQFISPNENEFLNFCKICTETLKKYAPHKRKTLKGNESPFINKEISRAIMKRTELNKTDESRQAFVKQRYYCVSLLRKMKSNYYSNLHVKDITDNKKFWKTMKPLFSNKTKSAVSIILTDNGKIVENQRLPTFLTITFQKLHLRSKFQNQITSTRGLRGCLILH